MHVFYLARSFLALCFLHLAAATITSLPQGANILRSATPKQSSQLWVISDSKPLHLGDGLTLKFGTQGERISPSLVNTTLAAASRSIQSKLSTAANSPIHNGRWAYGRLSDLQVIIVAGTSKVITYAQLSSVLDGLSDFVTGTECRNLAFDISEDDDGDIGIGLVWHDDGQPPSIAGQGAANNSSEPSVNPMQLPPGVTNSSHDSLSSANKQSSVPVPGTDMHLLFTFFGEPIPPPAFQAAYAASIVRILDAVRGHPNSPITQNRFDEDSTNTHIAVLGNRGPSITWLQLFQILQALYGFVTEEPYNYQILQYDIYLQPGVQFGIGLLWYYPPAAAVA
ncbi:hypothetical protein ACLMJK_001081 [Lecanora helva]